MAKDRKGIKDGERDREWDGESGGVVWAGVSGAGYDTVTLLSGGCWSCSTLSIDDRTWTEGSERERGGEDILIPTTD